jgi:cytochrome b561
MRLRDTPTRYALPSRVLHWASALLIILAWLVGTLMEEAPRGDARATATALHYTLGLLVLSLVALRLLWRLVNPPQAPEPGTPAWQQRAGHLMHLALYGLMLLVPLAGLLDRWARGRAVTVLGWSAPLAPPFPIPGGRLWGEAHELLADLMLVAVGLHVLAALWHHFVQRDGVLRRMTGAKAGALG